LSTKTFRRVRLAPVSPPFITETRRDHARHEDRRAYTLRVLRAFV